MLGYVAGRHRLPDERLEVGAFCYAFEAQLPVSAVNLWEKLYEFFVISFFWLQVNIEKKNKKIIKIFAINNFEP